MILSVSIPLVFADDSYSFGVRTIPNKIIENSDAIIQIYALKNGYIFPIKINNLIVTSLDSSTIKILEIDQGSGYVTNVKIKSLSAKTTSIALVAPGFTSYQYPMTVYSNTYAPTQLFLKTTPSTFLIKEAMKGYVSIELADKNGVPVRALDDIPIRLTTDNGIIHLKDNEIVVNKGEYFAVGEFEAESQGTATIYASTPSMGTVNSTVTINNSNDTPTVQLYVYPSNINSLSASYGYAIAQLHDSSGNPVIATEDVPVSLKITNSSSTEIVNTSGENPTIQSNEPLIIKKGSYWGLTKVVVHAGLNGTFNVNLSAKNYLVSSSPQITVNYAGIMDDKTAKIDLLPILATGNRELIGILYLEDPFGTPVIANTNLDVKIDSSDEKALSIDDTKIGKGFSVAPVFGEVGLTTPNTLALNVITEPFQSATPQITGTVQGSNKLVAEPAISKILANTDFPLALYMTKNTGEMTNFPKDTNSSILSDSSFQMEQKMISKTQSITLLNAKSLGTGSNTLTFKAGDYSTSSAINSISSKAATMHIDYPDPLLMNNNNIFTIQLLDSQQQPIFADSDTEIRLISNDQSILTVPDKVIIKKGEYFAIFSGMANQLGKTKLAALSSDLPLAEFDITVGDTKPQIQISAPSNVKPYTAFNASIYVEQHNSPLGDMDVNWIANGATIQWMDPITNKNGIANIGLFADSPNRIDLKAAVSGQGLETVEEITTISMVKNATTPNNIVTNNASKPLTLNGFDPMPFLVISGVIGGGLFLKKKNLSNFLKLYKS